MNKNLVLIYPPDIEDESTNYNKSAKSNMSTALLYLAASARNVCDSVSIFDMKLAQNIEKLDELLRTGQPGVVGINCLFSTAFKSVRNVATQIKTILPKTKIVIGGLHPTLFAEEIIEKCPEIDAVALGESDTAFPQLLRYWFGALEQDMLDSVVLRQNDSGVQIFEKKSYINCLDELPMPAYDLIDFNDYRIDMADWYAPESVKLAGWRLPLLTSRSCPNNCSFCSVHQTMGRKLRLRSAKNVFNEILFLYDTYGVNYFTFTDDNFTFDR
jgi:radical SAM superfamily enzyme YgiQ (UPF0313 family)